MSGKKRKSGRLSITQHWLRNNLGVVVGILVVLEILLIVVVRNYYYSSTRQYLTSKMKIVTTAVVNASGDEQITIILRYAPLWKAMTRKIR